MFLPINGRVAIIEDEINQALPLMKVFARHQIPYVFYKGDDLDYLPDEGSSYNDIRLLFLDINLINQRTAPAKDIKAVLFNVIRRVISTTNFPYSLIYWSKQQNDYGNIVEELFDKELKDRAPINLVPFVKSDFFPDFSEVEVENDINLIEEINKIIVSQPAYSYLLNWENQVFSSADKTLQEVFSSYATGSNWVNNANFIISKLSESFAGRSNYKELLPVDKIKNAFQAFNNVFYDTLEFSTSSEDVKNPLELNYDVSNVTIHSINAINKKLLISSDVDPVDYSGAVSEDSNPVSDIVFNDLLNNTFKRQIVEEMVKSRPENSEKPLKTIQKIINQEASSKRQEIRETWKKIYLVTTPLCDYVQKKNFNNRIVKGMIIKAEYINYIDDKSEAIFVSPKFRYLDESYIMVLNFRYFFTSPGGNFKYIECIFRVRHQLLAEIQSKLARHITRQGILFIE